MNCEVALRKLFITYPPIAAMIGGRFFPLEASTNAKRPYVVYAVRSDSRTPRPSGGLVSRLVELDCAADTYQEACDLAEHGRTLMDHWRGEIEGFKIRGAFLDDDEDFSEPPNTGELKGVFHRIQTWNVFFKELVNSGPGFAGERS